MHLRLCDKLESRVLENFSCFTDVIVYIWKNNLLNFDEVSIDTRVFEGYIIGFRENNLIVVSIDWNWSESNSDSLSLTDRQQICVVIEFDERGIYWVISW
jgi:hypothetical protein